MGLEATDMRIVIEIAEDQAERLRKIADRLGVRPEQIAEAGLADLLTRTDSEFENAVEYVLQKNEALYKRLS